MDYSQKISERQWNLPDKGELESRREETYIDDIIQKDHIQRKLLEQINGIRTVFDGGAGSGRFSILLAKKKPNGNALPPLLKCETADEDVLKHVRWAAMTISEWIKNHQTQNDVADIAFDRITVDVIAIDIDRLGLGVTASSNLMVFEGDHIAIVANEDMVFL